MEILLTAFNSCFPLLLLVGLGYFLKRINFIGQTTVSEMSKVILNVFLPINIFMSVITGNSSTDMDITYICLLFGIQILVIVINWILVIKKDIPYQQKSIIMQDAVRGNCSMFALPLSILIAGEGISSFAALSVAISSPVINMFSIVNFEYFEKKNKNMWQVIKKSLLSPLVLATFIGIVFKLINIKLPVVVNTPLSMISNCVTAVSLVMVGASFDFSINKDKLSKISYVLIFKMILTPILTIILCLLFKQNAYQTIILVCMYSSPIAVSSFATAKCYDSDIDLASSCLVYSYVVGIVTLPLIVIACSLLQLI